MAESTLSTLNAEEKPRSESIFQNLGSIIYDRVKDKKEKYRHYNLERVQEEAFATFFDLAQEYTSIDVLYLISVAVPKEFLGLESALHILDFKTSRLEKVCDSVQGLIPPEKRVQSGLNILEHPYETHNCMIFPIRGNEALTQLIPFLSKSPILGLFEICPKEGMDTKRRFFLEKFTNRIGFNLHQKMLIQQNINHLKFINQLVSDIEHNVISPNMYYRLFLIRLKKSLVTYGQAQERLGNLLGSVKDLDEGLSRELSEICQCIQRNNQSLEEDWKALSKHYEHTSLFLETLLRRDHFEKGTYVLRRQVCNFRAEIIEPLLERYIPIFEKKKIMIDNLLESVPDEQVTLFVDKGLISQVFDNLFSNAVKYVQQVEDELGNKIKLLSYNRQILKDFFGKGINGFRFNFFTTGKPLSMEESRKIFEEGYRAASAGKERGTGHGLSFVKNVVEIHGGRVGCEPQKFGNLFYFVLPLKG